MSYHRGRMFLIQFCGSSMVTFALFFYLKDHVLPCCVMLHIFKLKPKLSPSKA